MTTLALTAPEDRSLSAWQRHLIALALAAAAVLLLLRDTAAQLVHLWWTSTTFGHCLFIGPVIAWLVWQRRSELADLTPAAWPPGLVVVGGGGLCWLVGEAASVDFAAQLGLIVTLQGVVVTLLGPGVTRGLLFPLGYALLLVPFGEFLEGPLQHVTIAITLPLLRLVGVAASSDGVLIHAGRYYFEVAEACSGAKFVIAMVAFGALVAHLGFTRWPRRLAFLAVAIVVPVIANGLRAFATIWAADLTSVEAATGFDHVIYGWLFFGLVMAAVLALGWRWFDRAPDAPAFDPAGLAVPTRSMLPLVPATVLVLITVAIFPVWQTAITRRQDPLPARIDLPAVAGWHRVPLSTRAPWQPYYPAADHYLFGRYADSRDSVDMAMTVIGNQRAGHELIAFGTGVLREEDRWVRVEDQPPLSGGSTMRITAPGPVERIVASWYRVAGVTTADERVATILVLKQRLLGRPTTGVALHLSAEASPGRDPRATIERFAARLDMDRVADTAAGLH